MENKDIKIAVLGNVNSDFTIVCEHLPRAGETIKAKSFSVGLGGKASNVCVASARLGAKSKLISAVGDDDLSKSNLQLLTKENVDVSNVKVVKNMNGGVAFVTTGDGTNHIAVNSGANGTFCLKDMKERINVALESDVVVSQLEVAFECAEYLIEECYKHNKLIIFNPSPIRRLKQDLLDKSSYIIVNEVEIKELPSYESEEQMLKKYKGKLILTKGAEGVYFYENEEVKHIPALKVKAINTTGAGDTFLAAFSVKVAQGLSLEESITFANACAGIKTLKLGTQTGMPTEKEVKEFLKNYN